ncbi:MAG: class I SAM-dependent methyltransferase [Psychroflexus sp.]
MSLYASITNFKDRRRNASKATLIGDFFNSSKTIIDIGTGSGGLANYLKNRNFDVTSVDVVDKTIHKHITPVIYDGLHLPFKDQSFDASMLITVLHHCPDPEQVFSEAVRVSNGKIIILEDVYSNWLMKRLTWFMDSLVNMEFKGHPHSNKSETEWEALFQQHNLKVKKKTKAKVLAIFTQVMYHLEK